MRVDGSNAAIALAWTSFLVSSAAALALALPGLNLPPFSGLAPVREARAHTMANAADASPATLGLAAAETRASLREAPANATAWLRLAHIDSRDADGLGADGNLALARSYGVAPLGPDDTAWRLQFAFNLWTELDRANRISALDELRWAVGSGRVRGRTLLEKVDDPSGRLALTLMLSARRKA